MGELELHGYLVRTKSRNEAGQWTTELEVHERPPGRAHPGPSATGSGIPGPGKPHAGPSGPIRNTVTRQQPGAYGRQAAATKGDDDTLPYGLTGPVPDGFKVKAARDRTAYLFEQNMGQDLPRLFAAQLYVAGVSENEARQVLKDYLDLSISGPISAALEGKPLPAWDDPSYGSYDEGS